MSRAQAQGTDHLRGAGLVAGWVAVFALAAWLRLPSPWWLVAAGVASLVFAGWTGPWYWRGVVVAAACTWLGIGVAGGVSMRLFRVETLWPEVRSTVEDRAGVALRGELEALRARADTAVTRAARSRSFAQLEQIRSGTGVSALALYDARGRPLAWAGEHRGRVPAVVRQGERAYEFGAGPLFNYAYFTRPAEQGRTAVGAVLLDANLPAGEGSRPFAERFAAQQGIRPVFTLPDRARGDAVWDWLADRPIFSVTFATLTQARWRARVAERGRWVAGGLCMLGLFGLVLLGRGAGWPPGALILPATAGLLLVPWATAQGTVLVGLLGLGAWLLGAPVGTGARLPPGLAMVPAALLLPGVLWLVRAAAPGALATEAAGGIGLQLGTVLLIALLLWVLLRWSKTAGRTHPELAWASLALATLLAAGLVSWAPVDRAPLWTAALWTLPFGLFAWSVPAHRDSRLVLLAWTGVVWIAASAALPHLWMEHWRGRLEQANSELARLGTQPDPRLDDLLRDFAEQALLFAADGDQGVNLLYRSWVASGLAREGYETRIALWRGDAREAELGFSEQGPPASLMPAVLAAARAADEPLVQRYTHLDSLHYLLAMSLPGGTVATVAVPPQRRLDRATALGRFLDPDGSPGELQPANLSLVPAPPGAAGADDRWLRTPQGWRSEVRVPFPRGPMHAHLLVETPPPLMLATRTLLLGALHLGLLVLLWGFANALRGDTRVLGFAGWTRTFRGRLTIALFGFFLLPTLVFSATAYQALSREVVRTAEALASRSLEQAVDEGADVPIEELARHVRADLLLYRNGVLEDASSPEAMDLGLYPTWLPRETFLAFRSGEVLDTVEQRNVSGHPFLFAYHRRGADAVLAAPRALVSGDIERRQQDLAATVLLVGLLGAGLSFGLSLLVGRALSAPIERLSRAAAAVGQGNLAVRLPEAPSDEFGGLFRSFNRMVRRLRQARSAEVRTARVLAWGEMARQVAHEIKNPLTPIKLSVQHLRRAYRDGRPDFGDILDRNVDGILREIDRLGEIARAFARFGTPAEAAGDLERVDLESVLADSLALYRSGSDEISFVLEVAPGTPPVQARAGELKEVLINLLENARAALDGSGEVAVRALPVDAGWVGLEVVDTGVGIPAEALPRIFEPQFSTRTSGTGLGLAIVRRLVEGWGAEITAESQLGVGTTMRLRLRVAPHTTAD